MKIDKYDLLIDLYHMTDWLMCICVINTLNLSVLIQGKIYHIIQ